VANAVTSTQTERPTPVNVAATSNWRRLRLVPLLIGAAAMALGLWTGLQRLGVPLPGQSFPPNELHSAFMISGFLGTVISLERAVAIGRGWAYGAPVLAALGALLLMADAAQAGALAFVLASLILLAATASLAVRQFAMFMGVLILGAACWTVGTVLWMAGQAMPTIAGWWLSFLILTIAAERLELSRILRVSHTSQAFFFIFAVLLLAGVARGELADLPAPLMGVGLVGLAGWLIRHDVAKRTIRSTGLPRFSAAAILAGHVWLATAGLLLLLWPSSAAAFAYDAVIHAIAIGFVLSMIFAHAPIILPAVTGLRVRFSSAAYGPLGLLHLSVLIRVIGDALESGDIRAVSGVLSVAAFALYGATLVAVSWRHASPTRPKR